MNRLAILLSVATISAVAPYRIEAHEFGVGAVVGDPTAISAKAWTGRGTAFDFALAWSRDNDHRFNFHMDYLFHDYGAFENTEGRFPLYYGIGGRVVDANDPRVGVRIPVGVNYLFGRSPFDTFFEIAPVLDVTPETEMDIEAGIGARFYFK